MSFHYPPGEYSMHKYNLLIRKGPTHSAMLKLEVQKVKVHLGFVLSLSQEGLTMRQRNCSPYCARVRGLL